MNIIDNFKKEKGVKYAILIRHSNREKIPNGIHDIVTPINKEGEKNAIILGEKLNKYFSSLKIFSSPVDRCMQTAKGIINGFGKNTDIIISNYLGEPGPYVFDSKKATNHFINLTTRVVVEKQIQGITLEGIRDIKSGSEILKNFIFKEMQINNEELIIFVSHDAIIAPFIYTYTSEKFGRENWIDFLDGVIFEKINNQIKLKKNGQYYEVD